MQGLFILRWSLRRYSSLTHEPFCRLHMLFTERVPHFVRAGPVYILALYTAAASYSKSSRREYFTGPSKTI